MWVFRLGGETCRELVASALPRSWVKVQSITNFEVDHLSNVVGARQRSLGVSRDVSDFKINLKASSRPVVMNLTHNHHLFDKS